MKHLLQNLPTLGERVNHIRTGKAATNAVDNDRELEKSNQVGAGAGRVLAVVGGVGWGVKNNQLGGFEGCCLWGGVG